MEAKQLFVLKKGDKEPIGSESILDALRHISLQYPVPYNDLIVLFHKHNDLITVETIVHIAATNLMPLWAAQGLWVDWWQDNKQLDCPGELYRVTVVLDKDIDAMPVCFEMVVVAGKLAQAAPIARWQVGRYMKQVREWVSKKEGTMERIESEG